MNTWEPVINKKEVKDLSFTTNYKKCW